MPEGQLDITITLGVIVFAFMLVATALARSIHNARALSDRDAAKFDALAAIEAQTADDPCVTVNRVDDEICGHARDEHVQRHNRSRGACSDRDCTCPNYTAERPVLEPVAPYGVEVKGQA